MFAIGVFVIISFIVVPLLLVLPVIDISVPAVVDGSVYSYIRAGAYFLPIQTIGAILTISLGLFLFRILIAVIRAVWDVLPIA